MAQTSWHRLRGTDRPVHIARVDDPAGQWTSPGPQWRFGRSLAYRSGRDSDDAPRTVQTQNVKEHLNLIYTSKHVSHLAFKHFEDRQDMTDCMSIITEMNGIQDILTSNKHFTQAGFNILI
jgi:predicted nucleic acid-binding protein